MILPETLPDVVAAETRSGEAIRPVDVDAAAARTRGDYGRVSRWALGILGTAGAAVAAFLLGFAIALTILFIAVCAGQFGGVQRIQNGYLARDPMPLFRRGRPAWRCAGGRGPGLASKA